MKCSEQWQRLSLKLLITFLFLFSFSFGKTSIYLKKYVEVEKDEVYLSDIASVVSDNKSFASFLETLPVVKNLKPGQKIIVSAKKIKNILRQNYINTAQLQIIGGKTVIKRKIIYLDKALLEKKVVAFLKEQSPDFKIIKVNLPSFKRLVFSSPYTLKFEKTSQSSSYIHLKVYLYKGEKLIKKFSVSVKYKQLVDAVFAKRQIIRGQMITSDDVYLKKTEKKVGYITDLSLVVGAIAKTTISAGKAIKINMIEPNYAVKRGSNVKVIYDRNGIKIEIMAKALENGQKGQIIKVKNTTTGKVLPCKVIGKDTVLFVGGL